MNTDKLVKELKKLDDSRINYIDWRAMNLLAHVIYKDIQDYSIMSELNIAIAKIMDDCKILGITIPYILIECITGGRYRSMMPPILNQYWHNFINAIEYLVNPNPEMEAHISEDILSRAEYNARQFVEAHLLSQHSI